MQDTKTGNLHQIENTSQAAKDKALPRERQGIILEIGQHYRVAGQTVSVHSIRPRFVTLRGTDMGGPEFLVGAPIALNGAAFRVTSRGQTFLVVTPAANTKLITREGQGEYICRFSMRDGTVREITIQAATAMLAWRASLLECDDLDATLFEII